MGDNGYFCHFFGFSNIPAKLFILEENFFHLNFQKKYVFLRTASFQAIQFKILRKELNLILTILKFFIHRKRMLYKTSEARDCQSRVNIYLRLLTFFL